MFTGKNDPALLSREAEATKWSLEIPRSWQDMGQILLSVGPWEALPPPSHPTPCLPDRQAEGCHHPPPPSTLVLLPARRLCAPSHRLDARLPEQGRPQTLCQWTCVPRDR